MNLGMTLTDWIRAAALYLPIMAALLAGLLRPRRPRAFAACLLSFLWTLCTLALLQHLSIRFQWWSFAPAPYTLIGMPLELYLGWAVLWGLVPQLLFYKLDPPEVAILLGALDLYMMAICRPALRLNDTWPVGEVVALLFVLLPALYIARFTLRDTHRNARCAFQLLIAGMLFLFLLPEIAFALRPAYTSWTPLLRLTSWKRQLGLQLLILLALPGVSAVTEFAQRGAGTPIPYDPPQRLVTSGIYRFCANPMQLSCTLVLLLWAVLLQNPWLLVPACVSAVYSAGIAEWDEARDLALRFPAYPAYRRAVPAWRLRWRPYAAGPPARLYISHTCNPCSHLLRFLNTRNPLGMELIPAETLPAGSIRRLRYDPADGTPPVDGIRAAGRALEHLHLGWAYCGLLLRLPLLWPVLQLITDAIGFGPRTLPHQPALPPSPRATP